MGYKSVIRSLVATSNRIERERQRTLKAQHKALEKIHKKTSAVHEQIEKIVDALEDIYAKGKISKERYEELKPRKNDISVDLIILGKGPAVSLAKRYITGAIEKSEFEQILGDLLPSELFAEKQAIKENIDSQIENLKNFQTKSAPSTVPDTCWHCGKSKSFFDRLKTEQGLLLCRRCRQKLSGLRHYKGFKGSYFTVEPKTLSFTDLRENVKVEVNFNLELLT